MKVRDDFTITEKALIVSVLSVKALVGFSVITNLSVDLHFKLYCQDINKFRFELVDILSKNNFDIGKVRTGDGCYGGRRAKQMERRIMKVDNINMHWT